MEPPTNGAHLQQFVYAMQSVSSAVPSFSAGIISLSKFLEKVYQKVGTRTRLAVARFQLIPLGWGPIEQDAFNNCKYVLAHHVTLAHRDVYKRLCVYTDAPDLLWSGIVT